MKSLVKEFYNGSNDWVCDNTILFVRAGSHAYGTSTPSSDEDYRGLCIPPKEYFYGFSKSFEQVESKIPYDLVIYEIRKFFKLASNANPNVLETLFVEKSDIMFCNSLGELLINNRKLFLSKKCLHTYAGYAKSALYKIKEQLNQTGKYDSKDAMHLVRLLRM